MKSQSAESNWMKIFLQGCGEGGIGRLIFLVGCTTGVDIPYLLLATNKYFLLCTNVIPRLLLTSIRPAILRFQ